MSKYIAYGFANTNRSDIDPTHTLAYKQLEVFGADRVVDVHWHSDKREQLEKLIEIMQQGDILYMYSIDTLLKGKNKGLEYYKQIINKGISLFILDNSGDLPKISPVSTFYNNMDNPKRILTSDEKSDLISRMEEISKYYVDVPQTGKTTYKANINAAFKNIYFMYESYRINEKQMLKMIAEDLGMTTKQTFISLSREYEKSLQYVGDFYDYMFADKKILELPKRTGKLPCEYDKIMQLVETYKNITEREKMVLALKELNILSNPEVIHRWTLNKQKVPKPRKSDGRIINFTF